MDGLVRSRFESLEQIRRQSQLSRPLSVCRVVQDPGSLRHALQEAVACTEHASVGPDSRNQVPSAVPPHSMVVTRGPADAGGVRASHGGTVCGAEGAGA